MHINTLVYGSTKQESYYVVAECQCPHNRFTGDHTMHHYRMQAHLGTRDAHQHFILRVLTATDEQVTVCGGFNDQIAKFPTTAANVGWSA